MKKLFSLITLLSLASITFAQMQVKQTMFIESTANNPVDITQQNYLESVSADDLTTPDGVNSVLYLNLIKVNLFYADRPLIYRAADQKVRVKVGIDATTFSGQNDNKGDFWLDVEWKIGANPEPHDRFESIEISDPNIAAYTLQLKAIEIDGVSSDTLPQDVLLQGELITERYSKLNTSITPNMFNGSAPTTGLTDLDGDNQTEALTFKWNAVTNAQVYQLEWAYINDYDEHDIDTPRNPSELPFDFKRNATRIETSDLEHVLNLIFDRGWIVYRIRTVGLNPQKPSEYVYGNWSTTLESGYVSSLPSANKLYIDATLAHESKLNWQYSATYAEEGKKKEVITYFDGSLRNRQMVTRVNSDDHAIVGETIYDFEGRPVINVLPTPAFDGNDASPSLKYYKDFNKAEGGFLPYAFEDFDLDAGDCENGIAKMDTSSGASRYYSSNNPDQSKSQGMVPDAMGYPFTQVQYTSDNTGRVKKQSGVGEDFSLNSDHATKYFYGVPNQPELDRLFGSEVGYASHYSKQSVVDPNGQVSVSYMDQEERVIATALAGVPPNNLIPLESATEPVVMRVNALNKQTDKNVLNNDENGYIYTEKVLFTNPTQFKVDYSINIDPFIEECIGDICFQCQYNLSIKLIDECGENVLRVDGPTGVQFLDSLIGQIVFNDQGERVFEIVDCTGPGTFTLNTSLLTETIPLGEYTLVKSIKINDQAHQRYIQTGMDPTLNECVSTYDDFLEQEMQNVDSTLCESDCASCLEDLGSLAQYLNDGRGTQEDYMSDYNFCRTICENGDASYISPLAAYSVMLEVDMSPGGQYALFDSLDANGAVSNPLSIFNPKNFLPAMPNMVPSYNQIGVPGSSNRQQWKYPYQIKSNGSIQYGYYDETGRRSKIRVAKIRGQWTPRIQSGVNPVYDNNAKAYFIYPEQLKNTNDFYSKYWNPSWAKSLILYHPEFGQYLTFVDYTIKFKHPIISSIKRSSNDFDELLLNTGSFQEAVDNGFIKEDFATRTPSDVTTNWFSRSSLTPVDPFVVDFGAFYNPGGFQNSTLKSLFEKYQQIDGRWLSMPEYAAYITRCANYGSISPSCFAFGSGNDPAILDKEWDNLKKFYLSAKENLQKKRAMLISVESDARYKNIVAYNECIGEESFNPFESALFQPQIFFSSFNFLTKFFGAHFSQLNQPCAFSVYKYYQDKTARFSKPENETFEGDTDQIYHDYYRVTGQCPEIIGIQTLLKKVTQDQQLGNANGVALNQYRELGDLFTYINGYEYPGAPPEIRYTGKINNTNSSNITIRWENLELRQPDTIAANTQPDTILHVNLDLNIDKAGQPVSWNQVLEIVSVKFTNSSGQDQLYGTALVNGSQGEEYIEFSGIVLHSRFQIGNCQFESVTTTNQLAKDVGSVLTLMKISGNLFSTTPIDVQPFDPEPANSLNVHLPESIAKVLKQSSNIVYKYNSTDKSFELYSTNNPTTKLVLRYLPKSEYYPLDNNFVQFTELKSRGGSLFKHGIKTGNDEFYEMHGSLSIVNSAGQSPLSTGTKSLPAPPACREQAHENYDQLLALLEDLLVNKKIQSNNNPLASESAHFYSGIGNRMAQGGIVSESTLISNTNDVEFTVNNCVTSLTYISGFSNFNFNNITQIVDAYTLEPEVFLQGSNTFILKVKANDPSVGYDRICEFKVQTCLPLKKCETCEEPEAYTIDQPSPQPPIASQTVDPEKDLRNAYGAYVEIFNDFLQGRMDYNTYLEYGLSGKYAYIDLTNDVNLQSNTAQGIIKFLEDTLNGGNPMNVGFASSDSANATSYYFDNNANSGNSSTQQNGGFAIDLYSALSGIQLYDDYVATIQDFNGYIDLAGNSQGANYAQYKLDTLSREEFFTGYVADSARFKLNQIQYMLDTATQAGPAPVTFSTTIAIEQISPTPIEDSLYKIYYQATTDYLNNSITPCRVIELYTLSELRARNTFCSAEGLTNFNQVIQSYVNNDTCPGYLDRFTACSGNIQRDLSARLFSEYAQLANILISTRDSLRIESRKLPVDPYNEVNNVYNIDTIEFVLPPFGEFLRYPYQADPCDERNHRRYTSVSFPTIIGQPVQNPLYEDVLNLFLFADEHTPDAGRETRLARFVMYANRQIASTFNETVYVEPYATFERECDTLNPDPVDFCYDADVDFTGCLSDIANFSMMAFPNSSGPIEQRLVELGDAYNQPICYCSDEYCNRVDEILSGNVIVSSYAQLVDYVNPASFCNQPIAFCEDTTNQFHYVDSGYVVEIKDPCIEFQVGQAISSATKRYQDYTDSLYGYFNNEYKTKCLALRESMQYEYLDQQHHYTLYYYDQAGNLIKTVPPEGVEILDIAANDSAVYKAIQNDRLTGSHSVMTSHRMTTGYEYNSLNQLIYQRTPDTDPMSIFNVDQPKGLPYDLSTNKVQMVDEKTGYLAGHRNGKGVLYKTIDGGKSWKWVNDLIASNLNAISMVDAQNGIAVGDNGLILSTQNGGMEWSVVSSLTTNELTTDWLDAETQIISSNTHYFFVGKDLVFATSTDLVNFQTVAIPENPNAVSQDIVKVHFDQQSQKAYLLCNFELASGDVYSTIFTYDPITQVLEQLSSYSSTEYLDVDVVDNNLVFSAQNGEIYAGAYSTDQSETEYYQAISVEQNVNLSSFVFLSDTYGVGIDTKGPNSPLVYTNDGGKTWNILNGDNFSGIEKSKDGQLAFAYADNGRVVMIPIGSTGQTAQFKVGGSNIEALWVKESTGLGDQIPVVVAQGTELFVTNNINDAAPIWYSYNLDTTIGNNPISKIVFEYEQAILDGIIQVNDKSYMVHIDASVEDIQPTITRVFSQYQVHDVELDAELDRVFATTATSPYKLVQSNYVQAASNLPQIALPEIDINEEFNLKLIEQGDFVLTSDQSIVRVNSTLGLSAAPQDNSDKLIPAKLNFISKGKTSTGADQLYFGGENGEIYQHITTSNTVERLKNSSKADYTTYSSELSESIIAGKNGYVAKLINNGTSITLNEIYVLANGSSQLSDIKQADITGIAIKNGGANGNKLVLTLNDGSYFDANYLSNHFQGSFKSTNTPSLNDVTTTGNKIISLGDKASIIQLKSNTFMQRVRIYPSELLDLHFDNQGGIVLGKDRFVRTYNTASGEFSSVDLTVNEINQSSTPNYQPYNKVLKTTGAYLVVGNENRLVDQNNQMAAVDFTLEEATAVLRRKNGSIILASTLGGATKLNTVQITNGNAVMSPITGVAPIVGVVNDFHCFDNNSYFFVTASGQYQYNNANHTNRFAQTVNGYELNGVNFVDRKNGAIVGNNGLYLRSNNFTSTVDNNGYLTSIAFDIKQEVWDEPGEITPYNSDQLVDYNTIDFVDQQNGFIGGVHTGVVAKLAQLPSMNFCVFDPNLRFSSRFFYDRLGRLVVSQNSRQFNEETPKFSYTLYDELGRVIEVGEKTDNENYPFEKVFGVDVNTAFSPTTIDDTKLRDWVIANGLRKEVTKTFYDEVVFDDLPMNFAPNEQTQRKRITHVAYYEILNPGDLSDYDHATHYEYDIHGNVEALLQDNKKLAFNEQGQPTALVNQRFKRFDYKYDLISGNVHSMSYQYGESDQWHHAYEYDGDNRIVAAYTSDQTPLVDLDRPNFVRMNEPEQSTNWDVDATYEYYDHGPLARTIVGDKNLQGMDYVYNVQGWLKGVNSTSLSNDHDPRADGAQGGIDVPSDLMGFNLHYYSGDYRAINGSTDGSTTSFAANYNNSHIPDYSNDLYNGNIKSMQTSIRDIETYGAMPMANAYRYDQLNRLKESRSFDSEHFDAVTNSWIKNGSLEKYYNAFTYDANGNILTQIRKDSAGNALDDLTYRYHQNADGKRIRNRLYHLNDAIQTAQDELDLEDMGVFNAHSENTPINESNNYRYDEEGRLIEDKAEGLTIEWRVDGKVKKITDVVENQVNDGEPQKHKYIEFDYDAMGNRIAKRTYDNQFGLVKSTYYLLDAQGNTLSTYEHVKEGTDVTYHKTEQFIYGSSRLGVRRDSINMLAAQLANPLGFNRKSRLDGEKTYEMSNHLGNVLTTFDDVLRLELNGNNDLEYRLALNSTADYSPFGVTLDGNRTQRGNYRYAFQGQESDDEVKGAGNSVNYKYRMHDPRLGRFFAVDPLAKQFAFNSPYAFSENVVINDVELEGLERASRQYRRTAWWTPRTGRVVNTVVGYRSHMNQQASSLRTGRPAQNNSQRPANRFEVQNTPGMNLALATRNYGSLKGMMKKTYEEAMGNLSGEISVTQIDYFDPKRSDVEFWNFTNPDDKAIVDDLEAQYNEMVGEMAYQNLKEQGFYQEDQTCTPCANKPIKPETIPSTEKIEAAQQVAKLVLGPSPKAKLKSEIAKSPTSEKSTVKHVETILTTAP